MNRRFFIPIIAMLLLTSCSGEKFVPDPNDIRLPQYTEDGNMVGGALVNNLAWKTRRESKTLGVYEAFYFTNYANGDSLTLDLQGKFTEGKLKDRAFDFLLVFKGMQLKNITDLIAFEGRTITLDGKNNYVIVYDYTDIENDVEKIISGGTGSFTINRAQEKKSLVYYRGLSPNRTPYHPLTFAGTFNFDFPSENIKVELGRYDFLMSDKVVIQVE